MESVSLLRVLNSPATADEIVVLMALTGRFPWPICTSLPNQTVPNGASTIKWETAWPFGAPQKLPSQTTTMPSPITCRISLPSARIVATMRLASTGQNPMIPSAGRSGGLASEA